MAVTVARLEAILSADTKHFDRAMGKSESSIKRVGKTAAIAAGAAGIGAIAYTLKTGISEWMEQQKVAAQTNAVLKSTKGVANVTAKEISGLATSLMRKSGIDDEAIQSGENLLLTFKNIRNETGKGKDMFTQATQAALDLSVAFHKDMRSSSILVGKALNDPVKGLTALQRVGVTFTAGQKEQIKALVESGKTQQAQKIIMAELKSEVGGSAEAYGKTLPGMIAIAKESFNNFAGDLITKMIPTLQSMVDWVRRHWPEISAKFKEVWEAVRPVLKAWADYVGTVIGLIRKHWGTIGPILEQVVNLFKGAMQQIANFLKLITAILKGDWSAAWDAIKAILRTALDTLIGILRLWKDTVLAAMVAIGKAIVQGIWSGIVSLKDWFKEKLTGLFHSVIDWVKGVLGISSPSSVFHDIGVNMVKGMVSGIGSMGGFLKDAVIKLAKEAPGRIFGAIRGAGAGAANMAGLDPQVANAVIVAKQRGWHGVVTSGFRTYAEQAALYARYLAGGPLAARPGTSSHERGEAVDVTDYATFGRIMRSLPAGIRLQNFLGSADPVHYSVTGYDRGGWLPPGLSLAYNGTGAPERVGGGGNTFIFPNYVGSKSELMSWLQNAARQYRRQNGRGPF